MVVQLSILVGNIADLLGLGYTRIEVWQSTDEGNSFQEVTASAAAPATLASADALTTFQMGGRLLKLSVNGAPEVSILFSNLVPLWTPSQVAAQINTVVPGLASVSGSKVVLTSPTTGRASSIEVTYNDATDLGWVGGQKVYGLAVRPTLVSNTYLYSFSDVAGSSDDRYKWRFSANGVNPVSEFSAEVSGETAALLDPSLLSVGTAKFFDSTGHGQKTTILVAVDSVPQSISGGFMQQAQPISVDSDDNGFLVFTAIRNSVIKVAIEGSAYIREFTVPDAATFDLLTVMAAAPDQFTVQTVPPLLTRRSI